MKKRNLSQRRIGNVPAVAALGVMLLMAAQAQAAGRDLSTPRKAVEAFNEAFRTGDLATARGVTVSDPRSVRFVEMLVSYGKQLRRAITGEKAGDSGIDFVNLDETRFVVDGDTALVIEANKNVGQVQRVEGKWKFDPAAGLSGDSAVSAADAVGRLARLMGRVS